VESGHCQPYGLSMLWHTKEELEAEGRPGRKEMIWVSLAFPLLLTQLTVWISRVWRSFHGHPLESVGITAKMTGPIWPFVGVLAIYVVGIVVAAGLLWACCLQAQRWVYWRGR
jgi:hypothetical protein